MQHHLRDIAERDLGLRAVSLDHQHLARLGDARASYRVEPEGAWKLVVLNRYSSTTERCGRAIGRRIWLATCTRGWVCSCGDIGAAVHRAQADALEIEAQAKRRLADEYDAAQERGEVASQGKPSKGEGLPTTAELGLSHKEVHEARTIRAAEEAEPGIVRATLESLIEAGEEPTKAALKEENRSPHAIHRAPANGLGVRLRDRVEIGKHDKGTSEKG